jgi:CelD/BcsL family acetyltransferase involved in cellulose biosynthesis
MAVHGLDTTANRVVLHRGAAAFAALRDEWDDLAERQAPSPYTTYAWFRAFLEAFGGLDDVVCPAVHATNGALRAVACLTADRFGGLRSATNDHSGDWDVVAVDDAAREELLRGLAALRPRHLLLEHLVAGRPSAELAPRVLREAGYRLARGPGNRSPYLRLPGSYEELLRSHSANMRSQVARRGRQLERTGELELRTITGGPGLDAALDELFRVEASGWKAREGTAILTAPGAEQAYRAFAHAAAARGWLRVYLLAVGGRVVAGDLGCAINGTGFLIKTGFDEDLGKLSPGLVLRGRVLAASIEEGLEAYDFLGPDDAYKLRWTSVVRPRVTLRAYRGAAVVPGLAWHVRLRPLAKRALAAVRARRS